MCIGSDQRVRIFKLIYVCMHHLIKSMRTSKCLREATSTSISNDGSPIYYLQFVLLYCLMPVFFLLNYYLFFPSF